MAGQFLGCAQADAYLSKVADKGVSIGMKIGK
jgi:hypothetical protein